MYFNLIVPNPDKGLWCFLVSSSLLNMGAVYLAYEVLDVNKQRISKNATNETHVSLHSDDLEVVRPKHEVPTTLKEPFYNVFVAMHLEATQSPFSHRTVPLLSFLVSLAEFEEADFDEVQDQYRDQYKGNFVSLLLAMLKPMKPHYICINFTHMYPG